MPEGDQDEGGIPVTVAAVLGRLHEPLNLGNGKIFPRPELVVWGADQNSPVFVTRPDQAKLRRH